MLKKSLRIVSISLTALLAFPQSANAEDFSVGQTVSWIQNGTPSNLGTFHANTTLGAGVAPASTGCTTIAQQFTYQTSYSSCFNSQNYTPAHFQFTPGATYSYWTLVNPNNTTNYTTFFTEFQLLIGGSTQAWGWTYGPNKLLLGGGTTTSSNSTISDIGSLRKELQAREDKIASNKLSLITILQKNQNATFEQWTEAGFYIFSKDSLNAINSAALSMIKEDLMSHDNLSKIVKQENLVYRISNNTTRNNLQVNDFVSLGLIAKDYKYKTTVVNSIKTLPSQSINSFEKLKVAIKEQSTSAESRYKRSIKINQ